MIPNTEPTPRFLRSSSVGTLFDVKDDQNNNTNGQGKLPALLSPPKFTGSCDNCKYTPYWFDPNIKWIIIY